MPARREIVARLRDVGANLARQRIRGLGYLSSSRSLCRNSTVDAAAVDRSRRNRTGTLRAAARPSACDGRTHAEARDAGARRAAQPVHAHREDARRGGGLRLSGMLAVGKPRLRPELLAVRHAAADRVRPAEQRRGVREVALGQRRRAPRSTTRARRRPPRCACASTLNVARVRAQHARGRRARPLPKRKSSPTSTQRAPSRRTSTSSMNASGVSAASRASKRATIRVVDAEARKTSSLLRSDDSRGGADSLGEEFARMRIERQHRRRQAQVLGGFDEPREHRLVAAMDAVEIADRQRDAAHPRRPEVPIYPHVWSRAPRRCKAHCNLSRT